MHSIARQKTKSDRYEVLMQKLQTNDTDAKKQRHIYHKYMNITVTNNKYRTNKKLLQNMSFLATISSLVN